ncbi:MAG: hypothetical protein N2381_10615 [Armatimonadetes bacterium]|nr:hypothetical protein [Armatimonadota bacterium]
MKAQCAIACCMWMVLCFASLVQGRAEQAQQKKVYTEIAIYDGDLSNSQVQLTLGQWGTGLVEEVEGAGYMSRGKMLRLTIYSLVEGGCFIFGKPIEIPGRQSSLYIVMWVKFIGAPTERVPEEVSPYGTTPEIGGGAAEYQPGADFKGGIPGVVPSAPVAGVGRVTANLTTLRLVLDFGKGWSELNYEVPFEILKPEQTGWVRLPIPLANARGLPIEPGLKLQRLLIGADKADELFIGRMLFVHDEEPLRATIKSSWKDEYDFDVSRNIEEVRHLPKVFIGAINMPIDFWIEVDEGASITEVLWDFDKSDGVNWEKPNAKGNIVRMFYPKPATYIVSVMVRDLLGLKEPLIVERKVKVLK